MSDYQKQVRAEAKAFYDEARPRFEQDAEEPGGKSATPNFSLWIDERGELSSRVEEISSKWGHKDYLWVKTNTRSRALPGGDEASNAFASFLQDVKHAVKKLQKR